MRKAGSVGPLSPVFIQAAGIHEALSQGPPKTTMSIQKWNRVQLCSISSFQSFSCVLLFATPWTAACQASLSITNPWSLLKLMSIELLIVSHHLILYRPLFLLLSIFPSIRVLSNESVFHIRWPKYWSFSFSPSNEYLRLVSFRID